MSSPVNCPRCGYANPQGNLFCSNCAGRLTIGPQPKVTSPSRQNASQRQDPRSTPRIWKSIEEKKEKAIRRAKTGLLLLIVGLILGPIPYAMYLGAIFAIIGAIIVILGQNRFDPKHSNTAIGAAVIYLVGVGIIFFATSVFANSIAAPNGKTVNISQALTDKINGFLIAGIISTIVIAVAYILFTYALQDRLGRLLLYVSFAVQLALSVIVVYIINGQIASTVSQSSLAGYYDPTPANGLLTQMQELQLLGLFPAVLFAVAYYRVYSRIGEMFPHQ